MIQRTNPFKAKTPFTSHSDDISDKEMYDVSLVPFLSSNGKTFVNLTISAHKGSKEDNSYVDSTDIISLHPSQILMIKKAILDYETKQINPGLQENPIQWMI